MPKKDYVNRGTQCAGYDKYGVPIPEYAEGLDGDNGLPIMTGPVSEKLLDDGE